LKENYGGNKKRREEAKRKWQEEKRNKKFHKKSDIPGTGTAPGAMGGPIQPPPSVDGAMPASDSFTPTS
jgi:hypothetical protein